MSDLPIIEVDVETRGLQWYDPAQSVFLVQFLEDLPGGVSPIVLRHPEDRAQIQAWLDQPDRFRAWNTKFDMHHLEAAGYRVPDTERWLDGMVVAHALDERQSVALKAVAARALGEGERDEEKAVKAWLRDERARRRKASKATGEEYVVPNYSDVPDELMIPYAKQDVRLTQSLGRIHDRAIENAGDNLPEIVELEHRVLGPLYRMERRGLPMHLVAVRTLGDDLVERLEELDNSIQDLAGKRNFNHRSPIQLGEALLRRGVPEMKFGRTEKGAVSVNAETLERIDDDLARAVLLARSEHKLLSTYVRPMLEPSWDGPEYGWRAPYITPEGRIHSNFRQVGAKTGRMSSSEPNVQNFPRDDLRLRYLVRADPGKVLISCDLDAIEMRIFAMFAGEGALLRAVQSGDDMHQLAADRAGLEDRVRPGGAIEGARQRGKTLNYAIVYGAGIKRIAATLGVSMNEAKMILGAYHRAFPEVGDLQREIGHKLEDRGYIRSPWGRRHRIKPDMAYMAVNALVQGTAADMFKASIAALDDEGCPMIIPAHDEILVECEPEHAEHWAKRLEHNLTNHPRITDKWVPLVAEAKIISRWSEAKDPTFNPLGFRR